MDPFGQGFASMTQPIREIEIMLKKKLLHHGGNAMLRWMVSNVQTKMDEAMNVKFVKNKSGDKIDGVVALAMAVGEYISVRSQTDIEEVDRRMEIEHLKSDPEGELAELTQIYIERGLDKKLAEEVAIKMTEFDALGTHLRDELGQFEHTRARPLQASAASAIAFTLGGIIPLIGALLPVDGAKSPAIIVITLFGLIGAGLISARSAGSPYVKTTLRVLLGGSLGMAITAGIGSLVHLTGI
jgi:VIT1/CCC1 family predicted Fe2+/Mn2+ transporter